MDWIANVWKPFVNSTTHKSLVLVDEIDEEVTNAIAEGRAPPGHLARQQAKTPNIYSYALSLIGQKYQKDGRKKRGPDYVFKYYYFLDLGTENHVMLDDIYDYIFKEWKYGTLGMKKQFIAAHAKLIKKVKAHCLHPDGLAKFERAFTGDPAAQIKANEASENYLKRLERIENKNKEDALSGIIQARIRRTQEIKEESRSEIWADNYGTGQQDSIKNSIKEYLQSDYARESEDLIMKQGNGKNVEKKAPLDSHQWLKITRYLTLRLQCLHGGRTELLNLTLYEWLGRTVIEGISPYTVKVERKFTKLSLSEL